MNIASHKSTAEIPLYLLCYSHKFDLYCVLDGSYMFRSCLVGMPTLRQYTELTKYCHKL